MPKLYMFYLGGNAGRSNIEVHDIQFAVCDDYREAIPALKAAWFGDADKILTYPTTPSRRGRLKTSRTCISSMSAVIARDSLPRRTLSDCSLPPRPRKSNSKPCNPC